MQLGRALAFLIRNGNAPAPGGDRQGHAALGLHAGAGAGGGHHLDGRRRELVGPLPTPGIANITTSMRADAGAVISASHNPYQDNGIKFFWRDGFKLPDETEAKLEELVTSGRDRRRSAPPPTKIGRAVRLDDARGRYIVFLKNTFPRELTLEGLTIVVDCAHGAAYKTAPAVLEELGRQGDRASACEPDGKNINDGCGAVHPESMARAVVEARGAPRPRAGRRRGPAHRRGREGRRSSTATRSWPSAPASWSRASELQKKTLVATVMSNMGLERAVGALGRAGGAHAGRRPLRRRGDATGRATTSGGEQSGHLVFLDHATTGDGTLAALQLLAVMCRQQKPLSELTSIFEPVPQTLLNAGGEGAEGAGGAARGDGRDRRGADQAGAGRPGARPLLRDRAQGQRSSSRARTRPGTRSTRRPSPRP